MNEFTMDEEGGFLCIKTKFGNLIVEQSFNGTSVKFMENIEDDFPLQIATHIEDNSYGKVKIISMVRNEE